MPRVARVVVAGVPHHVTQRGNNRQDVFFTDDDRRFYIATLRERMAGHRVDLLAWCLMTNHVHLVLVPRTSDGLEGAVGRTHWRHSQTINRLHDRSGHLWQGRFLSCPLDRSHLLAAMLHVERNPVRARIVRLAERHPWSSAAAHCGKDNEARRRLIDAARWARRFSPKAWQALLRQAEGDRIVERLRGATRTGRPLATDSMLSKLETKLNRRLRALPRGRPRKAGEEKKVEKGVKGRAGKKNTD